MSAESRFRDACRVPFSNGTEERSWQSRWCDLCVHDHGMHTDSGPGCDVYGGVLLSDFEDWPECWLPEPDDGRSTLPSRLVCQQFEPCSEDDCEGDPYEVTRSEIAVEVREYWEAAR